MRLSFKNVRCLASLACCWFYTRKYDKESCLVLKRVCCKFGVLSVFDETCLLYSRKYIQTTVCVSFRNDAARFWDMLARCAGLYILGDTDFHTRKYIQATVRVSSRLVFTLKKILQDECFLEGHVLRRSWVFQQYLFYIKGSIQRKTSNSGRESPKNSCSPKV